ncbi:arabinan endo-1,5-alpha-L-arabinosidase [Roseateles noduli]|uniref:arabinan endo-1,5-alpha-L-arabinosidase n=1 Tax=Roseateles noduli TaxID=2052484 RepID=UPI003D660C5E
MTPIPHRLARLALSAGAAWLVALAAACSNAVPPGPSPADAAAAMEDPAGAHDPTLIERDGVFHVFATGQGIQHLRSEDGRRWRRLAPVLTQAPAWWAEAVPAHRGLDVWAPKVFALKGRYWLLYSISTFGRNRSAIGLTSSASLDGPWRDDGLVVASVERDDFNAIDPDLFIDVADAGGDGRLWLSYGSFWGGIRVVEFDPATMRPTGPTRFIARGPVKAGAGAGGPIEAPTLVRHGDWVYLFVSHDFCCRGLASTYNIRVGRARSAQGPFLDRDGRDLMVGGGTPVEQGAGRWIGPGHQDVVGRWIVRHAYDAEDGGKPKLRFGELRWTEDGWPGL